MIGRAGVFLDRDGVLNEERSYIRRPEDLTLLPAAAASVRRFNEAGLGVIVVTNQSIVARGGCSEDDLKAIHLRLQDLLSEDDAHFDALYYCAHHPNPGPQGIASYAISCACRKPGIGMVQQAAREHGIDLSRSWMVGDSSSDIEMARRAGLQSILVRTGYGGQDGKYQTMADFVVDDIGAAADLILDARRRLSGSSA